MKTWLTEHRFALSDTLARIARTPWSLLLNVLVVGIALALPLFGFTLLKNLQPVSGQLASEPEISVFVKLDAQRSEAQELGTQLRTLPGVISLQFVPREEALDKLKQQPGMGDVIAALAQNPLPDAWVLHLAPSNEDSVSAAITQEKLAQQIRTLPKVEHVQVDSAWVRRMEALMRLLRLGLTLLAVALGVAVVAVIFNTIRLQVLTQREEIEVSRLVGATRRFIRRPFYYMGTLQGLAGGLVALGLVLAALMPLNQALGDFVRLYASDFRFVPLDLRDSVCFLAGTALLGWLGAMLSVGRHIAAPLR